MQQVDVMSALQDIRKASNLVSCTPDGDKAEA